MLGLGILGDIVKTTANVVGSITGSIIGVSASVIASTLGITVSMVNEALKAGCESYEDIRKYHSL